MPLTVTDSDLTFMVFDDVATNCKPSTVLFEEMVPRSLKPELPIFQLFEEVVSEVEELDELLLEDELLEELDELLEELDELVSTWIL